MIFLRYCLDIASIFPGRGKNRPSDDDIYPVSVFNYTDIEMYNNKI